MAELDFAAWTASIGINDQRAISAAGVSLDYETLIYADAPFSSVSSNTRIKTSEAGRYLVRYDAAFLQNAFNVTTKTRACVASHLRLNGSDVVHGRAQGYWRNAQSCTSGIITSAALLILAADDEVGVFAQRIDTESAGAGATRRDPGFEGQFSMWRLKDSWRLAQAKLTSDESASSTSRAQLDFNSSEHLDTGWSLSGGKLLFDATAAGSDYAALSHVFLVCIVVEADITSGTAEGELEIVPVYGDGFGNLLDSAQITSYAEGVNGCTKAVCVWFGLMDGINGEFGGAESISVDYLHRNSNATTFTPKAEKCSIQVVAIPRSQIEYTVAAEDAGGQAADVDGAITLDTTQHESSLLSHPGGDQSEIRAVSPGAWVLAMGHAYAAPNGSRSANRLHHRLQLQREAASIAQCGGGAHNRGTNGCDRSGLNAHGIVKLGANQDVQMYLDQQSNQTDTTVDIAGRPSGEDFVTRLTAIWLRSVLVTLPLGTHALQAFPPTPGVTVTAPLGTVALEGLAPVPRVKDTQALGTLAIEGFTPTPRIRQTQELGTLALVGLAPSPRLRVTMPLAELVLEPYGPTPIIRCTAPLGELVLEPYAPTPRVRCNPELGELVLESYVPASRVLCNPELGELVLEPYSPTPLVRCTSPLGELVIEPYDPAARIRCHPELGTLALEPFSPTIQADVRLDMPLGTIVLIGLPPEAIPEMLTNRKRLYDAMRQRILAAQFPWMQFDNLNAIIIEGTNQMPSSAVLNEKTATYTPVPKRNRRHQFQETNIWAWELILQFNRQVSCELFERDLLQTPVTLPEDEANGLEAVTFRFVSANYEHPTEQQPSTGTKATYQLVAEVSPR